MESLSEHLTESIWRGLQRAEAVQSKASLHEARAPHKGWSVRDDRNCSLRAAYSITQSEALWISAGYRHSHAQPTRRSHLVQSSLFSFSGFAFPKGQGCFDRMPKFSTFEVGAESEVVRIRPTLLWPCCTSE